MIYSHYFKIFFLYFVKFRFKKLYNGWKRYKTDGINNIHYEIVDLVFKKLYTWILVDLYAPDDNNHNGHRKYARHFSG